VPVVHPLLPEPVLLALLAGSLRASHIRSKMDARVSTAR
jgi:hypothetical protein